jgi:hypothetical protein
VDRCIPGGNYELSFEHVICHVARGRCIACFWFVRLLDVYFSGISLCDGRRLMAIGAMMRRFSVGKWGVDDDVFGGVAK